MIIGLVLLAIILDVKYWKSAIRDAKARKRTIVSKKVHREPDNRVSIFIEYDNGDVELIMK